MANKQMNPKLPLTDQDRDALDEMFEKLEFEDIKQIEATATRYSVTPLVPWEEQGWMLNSFIPNSHWLNKSEVYS